MIRPLFLAESRAVRWVAQAVASRRYPRSPLVEGISFRAVVGDYFNAASDWVSGGRSCSSEAIDPLRAARGADLACRRFSCSRAHPFEGCRVDAWEVEAKYGRRRFFAPPSVRCEWLPAVARVQRWRSHPLSPWPPSLLSLRHPRSRDAGLGRRSRGWSAASWVIGREPARLGRSIRFSFSGRGRGADLAVRGPCGAGGVRGVSGGCLTSGSYERLELRRARQRRSLFPTGSPLSLRRWDQTE